MRHSISVQSSLAWKAAHGENIWAIDHDCDHFARPMRFYSDGSVWYVGAESNHAGRKTKMPGAIYFKGQMHSLEKSVAATLARAGS